jgi:hypothetical protein
VSYETLKEIIKLQNMLDERIIFSPEQFHQLRKEIEELKIEFSKILNTLTFAIIIIASIQLLLTLYLLRLR